MMSPRRVSLMSAVVWRLTQHRDDDAVVLSTLAALVGAAAPEAAAAAPAAVPEAVTQEPPSPVLANQASATPQEPNFLQEILAQVPVRNEKTKKAYRRALSQLHPPTTQAELVAWLEDEEEMAVSLDSLHDVERDGGVGKGTTAHAASALAHLYKLVFNRDTVPDFITAVTHDVVKDGRAAAVEINSQPPILMQEDLLWQHERWQASTAADSLPALVCHWLAKVPGHRAYAFNGDTNPECLRVVDSVEGLAAERNCIAVPDDGPLTVHVGSQKRSNHTPIIFTIDDQELCAHVRRSLAQRPRTFLFQLEGKAHAPTCANAIAQAIGRGAGDVALNLKTHLRRAAVKWCHDHLNAVGRAREARLRNHTLDTAETVYLNNTLPLAAHERREWFVTPPGCRKRTSPPPEEGSPSKRRRITRKN
jgi:hypothetical protein